MSDLLQSEVELFLKTLSSRGYAQVTLKVYASDLGRFRRWVVKTRCYENVSAIDRGDLTDYCSDLVSTRTTKGKPLKATTRNRHLNTLRSFFSFLVKESVLLSNPASELSRFRSQRNLPKVPTYEEVLKLLAAVDESTSRGRRDRAWMEVFYGSAVRLAELITLDVTDVCLDEETLHVRCGKYGRDRFVPLTPESRRALKLYLEVTRPKLAGVGEPALFVALRGGGRMNRQTVGSWLKKYSDRAELKTVVTAHTLRHCCATHLLKNKASLRHIQVLLGHESLSTTQLYTKVEITDLREVIKRCHPRERFE